MKIKYPLMVCAFCLGILTVMCGVGGLEIDNYPIWRSLGISILGLLIIIASGKALERDEE